MDLTKHINEYVPLIQPSPIREFDGNVSKIDGIIKLTLGEPDFETPQHIKDAACQAIQDGFTTYMPTPGWEPLLEAACEFVDNKYGLKYDTDEVITTVGASEALSVALKTILNPGDKVIIPTPYFTMYGSMIKLYGGEPVLIDTTSNDMVLSAKMLEDALEEHGDSIKAVMLNYPSNPTGIMWSREEAQEFADILRGRPIFVISDEVYSEINYVGEHVSIAEFLREQTILINGVSKSHAMTGWRVGLMFAPRELTAEMTKVHQNFVTVSTSVSQVAAYEALKNGQDDAKPMVEEYSVRRDLVYDALTALGFEIIKPQGAFYIFAKIPADLNQNSLDFCYEIAKNAKVALIPGSAFGESGEGYFRLSYAASLEDLKEAMERITNYINSVRG